MLSEPSGAALVREPEVRAPQIDFNDTKIAFQHKSDSELHRSIFLFSSIRHNFLVKIAPPLVTLALKIGMPIQGALKYFFFDQFCGGYSLEDSQKSIEKLARSGVKCTLDYGVEAEKNETGYQGCVREILHAIEYAQNKPDVAFIALKITGIGGADLLEKAQNQKLNAVEKSQFERIRERLDTICKAAAAARQSILIDAEESWIQDVIDTLAEEATSRYNISYPVVYTTIQAYRHDRYAYLEAFFARAREAGVIPAVKLVRGAYLEKENERAQKQGVPTPMQASKKATDADFDKAALFMLERLDECALCAGTHNEESSLKIARYMVENGISRDNSRVYFSQLYGMSDHISFNLAAAGFNVSKYLPYGPLKSVLPYLFRRAQENTSIAGQTGRELVMLQKELTRRRKSN